MTPDAAIAVTGLGKTYRGMWGRTTLALSEVSLEVSRGAVYGLLGRNGAGKTTLVKILLSLVRPTAGRARIFDRDPFDSRARRRIGYLPEQIRLPEYLRAHSFLRYMARLNGVDRATLARRIPELLELVGLRGEKKLLRAYSKGMQQRLGLAQALINDPDLLLLDEPTEGLDPVGRKQVRDLLVELRGRRKTIFLNSHLLSEVELVCDQVMILDGGRTVRSGAPRDFMQHTGEYRVRVAEVTDAVRAAVDAVAPGARWNAADCTIPLPGGRAQLNVLIDRLRAAPVEIEAVEAVRSTLEEFFIEVVAGGPERSWGAGNARDIS
jgi:ABC-2 type transport system ATP-binding protein